MILQSFSISSADMEHWPVQDHSEVPVRHFGILEELSSSYFWKPLDAKLFQITQYHVVPLYRVVQLK